MDDITSAGLLYDRAPHNSKGCENVPNFVVYAILVAAVLSHRLPKLDIHKKRNPRALPPKFSICLFLLDHIPNLLQTGIHRNLQSQSLHAHALPLSFDVFFHDNFLIVFELSPPMTFNLCELAVIRVDTLFVDSLSVLLLVSLHHIFQVFLLIYRDRFLRTEFVHKHVINSLFGVA